MKKIFVYALVGSTIFLSPTYAEGFKPFYPNGGIDGQTTVPHVYSDGSNGTLAQIGQMADSSVQQTDIGAANGVAPTDSNKMMSAPVSGDTSASPVIATGTNAPRILSDRFNDSQNLRDLGAKLDGSTSDNQTIQKIYSNLGGGSVVHVPRAQAWDGTILNPDPTKNITWIFENTMGGWYPNPPGDGDYTLTFQNGPHFQTRFLNNRNQNHLASFWYWNDDPNFRGPLNGSYDQFAAANFQATTGTHATGNTSPVNLRLDSYGMQNIGAYDIGLPVLIVKRGNNSSWGTVINQMDVSGLPSNAFNQWNEYDLESNGYDRMPWGPGYGLPEAGNRCVFCVALKPHQFDGWKASTQISIPTFAQGTLQEYKSIQVAASDGKQYIWRAVETIKHSNTGITGSIQPRFPIPTHVVGEISGSTLRVVMVPQGEISPGDYLSGAVPTQPVKIVAQAKGVRGKAGEYILERATVNTGITAFYASKRVVDNEIVWCFSEDWAQEVSSLLWAGGSDSTTYNTIVAVQPGVNISDAVIDTSGAVMRNGAAPIRMAKDQWIDFSSDNTLLGRNVHQLGYSSGDDRLEYSVNGSAGIQFSNTDIYLLAGSLHAVNSYLSGNMEVQNGTVSSKNINASNNITTKNITVKNLVGRRNAYACLDERGNLFRSTTPCVAQ